MQNQINKGCIIILGAPNDNLGNLSLIATSRLVQGEKMLSQNPGFKMLLTGGIGKHFNDTNQSHWKYGKDFLINKLAVSPDVFLPDAIESTNSVEDIELAKPIFEKYHFSKIILVTSEFHQKRVQYIAEKALCNIATSISYSCVADSALDESQLKKLYDHEEKAIEYLRQHYKVARQ